ncbi:MAG: hypothetical protein CO040_04285 [Candidatus Pacebacteria bacterium CG_4_9_14_0_2_um_filter_36_8]|nr:MAG: hypothetical protein CO040_04285 [Candidatus Pacebacteria bacterium CG_4_9_14_0_2_um_filter_36_8]
MIPSPIKYYQNLDVIKPHWHPFKKVVFSLRSMLSMIFQSLVVFQLLFFNFFPFKVKIHNKKILDKAIKHGAVFLTVHSGPYPLMGRIIHDFYPNKKIVVTFYHRNKISVFPIFKKFFERLGVTVVALGGAMKTIGPILKSGGSMTLLLDARLPVPKHRTEKVRLFDKERNLSTGPYYLSTNHNLNVVPIYVKRQGMTLHVYALTEIPHQKISKKTFMKKVAKSLELMIEDTLKSWQTYDTFLLGEP